MYFRDNAANYPELAFISIEIHIKEKYFNNTKTDEIYKKFRYNNMALMSV